MGSLDLLSQATLCVKHAVNQLIKHSHTQLLDMNKMFMDNQNETTEGKTTLHEQIRFQETFMGFTEIKTASSNPQIMDLFSHLLGIAKNGFVTKK